MNMASVSLITGFCGCKVDNKKYNTLFDARTGTQLIPTHTVLVVPCIYENNIVDYIVLEYNCTEYCTDVAMRHAPRHATYSVVHVAIKMTRCTMNTNYHSKSGTGVKIDTRNDYD